MKEEQHEIIDANITLHDKHRLEIKLDVELLPERKNVYRVETYFFVPRSLNITHETYTKVSFYNSVQKYIRFKTPQIALKRIVDPAVEHSPLNRVFSVLAAISSGAKEKQMTDQAFDEIKLLGCVARGSIKSFVKFFFDEVDTLKKAPPDTNTRLKSLEENCLVFVADLKALISKVRSLRMELCNPIYPLKIREAFDFFDEFFSLTVADYLSLLLEKIREDKDIAENLQRADKEICDIILAQNSYRLSMGYPSVIKKNTGNEVLVYRRGVLKKFISSVLFLQIETSEWEGWIQFMFGVSAGLAMLFVTVVMLFAQNRYATDSFPFISIVVVSYIFKDRIKDWLRIWFSKGWTQWIADRQTKIKDHRTGQTIGVFKEAFSFVPDGKVPGEIRRKRNADNITSIDEQGKPERVMKYEKEVTLYSQKIAKSHERRKDLNDILRINIMPFLKQADDPKVEYLYLDPASRELETMQCYRVYHVNMLIKYESYDSSKMRQISYDRIRIVLNRNGIVRFERVHST